MWRINGRLWPTQQRLVTAAFLFNPLLIFESLGALHNDIWGVARGRQWYTRIIVYWGVITLAPLLLVVAGGLASGPHFAGPRRLLIQMPFVAGLAGLVWSRSPYNATNTDVRQRIESTCDRIAGTGTYWAHGRINASTALH